jgi:hypothetical protein
MLGHFPYVYNYSWRCGRRKYMCIRRAFSLPACQLTSVRIKNCFPLMLIDLIDLYGTLPLLGELILRTLCDNYSNDVCAKSIVLL